MTLVDRLRDADPFATAKAAGIPAVWVFQVLEGETVPQHIAEALEAALPPMTAVAIVRTGPICTRCRERSAMSGHKACRECLNRAIEALRRAKRRASA